MKSAWSSTRTCLGLPFNLFPRSNYPVALENIDSNYDGSCATYNDSGGIQESPELGCFSDPLGVYNAFCLFGFYNKD